MEQTNSVLVPAPETDPGANRIGPRPGSGKRTIVALAGVSVAMLVVAMATILLAGLSFWRSAEPASAEPVAKSYSGNLAADLRIAPVVKASESGCTDGGTPGRFAGCFTLGDGGMVVTVVESATTAVQDGKWVLRLRFSSADTVALRALTTQNERIALVLDGTVLTAPAVKEPITGGELPIAGDFTKKDVDAMFAELTKR
ncbi:SecDF P1 head subdomain-containing protein [Cryptosporangium japonicum]|uniref:SecDF P1 head subdomain-containing protein n=1 Tax=Cryptosporangium japonicum TaxID=80872 RepID=UPI0031D09CEE